MSNHVIMSFLVKKNTLHLAIVIMNHFHNDKMWCKL